MYTQNTPALDAFGRPPLYWKQNLPLYAESAGTKGMHCWAIAVGSKGRSLARTAQKNAHQTPTPPAAQKTELSAYPAPGPPKTWPAGEIALSGAPRACGEASPTKPTSERQFMDEIEPRDADAPRVDPPPSSTRRMSAAVTSADLAPGGGFCLFPFRRRLPARRRRSDPLRRRRDGHRRPRRILGGEVQPQVPPLHRVLERLAKRP